MEKGVKSMSSSPCCRLVNHSEKPWRMALMCCLSISDVHLQYEIDTSAKVGV
jgi:hypothetical protein